MGEAVVLDVGGLQLLLDLLTQAGRTVVGPTRCTRTPSRNELLVLEPLLVQALEDAIATVRLVSAFDVPDFEQPHEYVALRSPCAENPLERGDLVSSGGLHVTPAEFDAYVAEEHVPWSNALHAHLRGADHYAVGPLARYALNHDCEQAIRNDDPCISCATHLLDLTVERS